MSKRKKNNNVRRAQRVFQNTRIWSWESEVDRDGVREAHAESKIGIGWKPLTHKLAANMTRLRHNWVIVCRALCRCGDDIWIESEMRSVENAKINDFIDVYDEMREAVLNSVQKRHVIDCGWIIQTFGKDDRIDNERLPLIYLGSAEEERKTAWHLAQQLEKKEVA